MLAEFRKPALCILAFALFVGGAPKSFADGVTEHAPRIETDCEAECWSADLQQSSARFHHMVREWGLKDSAQLMWQLRREQCRAPRMLGHSRLVAASAESSEVEVDAESSSSAWVGNFWRFARAGSSSSTHIVAHLYDSSAQMEFDSATPGNSCHSVRIDTPARTVGEQRVGG